MSIEFHGVDVSTFPLFKNVAPEVVKRFMSSGFKFTYGSGAPIIVKNDTGKTFFMLLGGLAKLVLTNEQSHFVNVTLFKAGDFFGELSVLEPEPVRTANIVAATDVDIIAINGDEFLKLMHEHPELALNMARVLGQRIRAMNERMVAMTLPDMNRVCRTMMHLAQQGKAYSEEGPILLPNLPLKDWILFCNSSQDKFMKIMEHLRSAGALEWQNQRIVVKNLDLLSQLAKPTAAPAFSVDSPLPR